MSFKVYVDDNFHYQDTSARYLQGEYESWETAVAACRLIVDQYLAAAFKAGMSAAELYASYVAFGADPFITPTAAGVSFSAWRYAQQRCAEMCAAD